MKKGLIVVALSFLLSAAAQGQTFSSGSTGADGALDLAGGDREVQLPESGILNYTTVNIPVGRTLTFKRNVRNTPVFLLAQGSVIIAGGINIGADRGTPGPGGFHGGANGQPGFGPGGGTEQQRGGRWVGPLSLIPIIGGSGGFGAGFDLLRGYDGGAGGGAIVLASSTSIDISGGISAAGAGALFGRGSGSGGAIRLIANMLKVSGQLIAYGGGCNDCNHPGGPGLIRLEAPQGSLTFTGNSNPPAILSTINPTIVPSAAPSLNIVSIGGFTVPSYSGTRFDTVDLMLPKQLSDPITVAVQASNIPVGTQVKVTFSSSPQATSTTGTLSGTLASSTATLTISGLDRSGAVTYLFVSATFNLPQTAQNYNLKGRDQIAKVRVDAAPGAKPKFVFLRGDGSEIDPKALPTALLQQFEQ